MPTPVNLKSKTANTDLPPNVRVGEQGNTWAFVQASPTPPVHWTAIMSGLFTPLLAVFGLWIAYRQWVTARNKLKLDLFEKRYQIFEATRKVLGQSMKGHKPNDEDLYPFLAATSGAKWLFNEKVANYLHKELWGQLVDLQTYAEELEGLPVGTARTEIVQKRSELRKKLHAQFGIVEKLFEPFLQLSH